MNQINAKELQDRYLNHQKPLHVIDVREPDEYEEQNIGAVSMPLSRLKLMDAEGIEQWKDEEIIVHCRSGKRSLQACLFLQTMGFNHLRYLTGGLEAWVEQFGAKPLGAN